ncbi:MAG TPA: metallophosphoesterase [Actinomycetota bacterium]|nr:metallophosphoesterase [Actinomycetota bacterium]
MRLHLISDLHGAADLVREAGRGCDVLLVLGDLINVLDYHTMDGILVDVFGREPVAEAAGLRRRGQYEEARRVMRERPGDPEELRARFEDLARQQYERVFDALPDHAVVTWGNVDLPDLMRSFAGPGVRVVEAEVLEFDGQRFGILAGGLRTPLGIPGEIDPDEYDRRLEALGPVDAICTHQPPRIPWLVYDVLGRRFEPGSTGLIRYIRKHRPGWSFFGHVHQPLVDRMTIGPTRLVNVGHFRRTGRPWVHDTR